MQRKLMFAGKKTTQAKPASIFATDRMINRLKIDCKLLEA